MGILDGLLGSVLGSEITTAVTGLIDKHGGLAGLVQHLEKSGLGSQVASWVSNNPNQYVSSDQLQHALGSSTVSELAAKLGVSPQELARDLSTTLPKAIDALTPSGRL